MKQVLIMAALTLLLATPAVCDDDECGRTITVNGQAEIMVVPDEAVIHLGVEIMKPELDAAKAEMDRNISAIIAAAKKSGVSEDDLRTDQLHIRPRYRDMREEKALLGYVVRQTLMVMVRKVDDTETVLSACLDAGANEVHSVHFQTSDPQKHRAEARGLALDAAREKATVMAERLGEKIGRPLRINEGYSEGPRPLAANVMRMEAAEVVADEGTLVAGKISITARVAVTFELVD